jgi:hypothetical protein
VGKRQKHDQADHVGLSHIKRACVVGSLELLKGHAELSPGTRAEHGPALFTSQLHDAAVGGNRAHGYPLTRCCLLRSLTVCLA